MKERTLVNGFTLIEVLAFIVISSLLLTVMLYGANTVRSVPNISRQWMALELARECMERFVGLRQINGFTSLTCPSTPSASLCVIPAAGYTISANVTCSTWNSDNTYKTLTITASSPSTLYGTVTVSLSTQFGDY